MTDTALNILNLIKNDLTVSVYNNIVKYLLLSVLFGLVIYKVYKDTLIKVLSENLLAIIILIVFLVNSIILILWITKPNYMTAVTILTKILI
jgi:hypothetical protein